MLPLYPFPNMKSILTTVFLLVFTIGVKSITDDGVGSSSIDKIESKFRCSDANIAASCSEDVEKLSLSSIQFRAMIVERDVVVATNKEYATCVDFINEILGNSNCKTCTIVRIPGDSNPNFCLMDQQLPNKISSSGPHDSYGKKQPGDKPEGL